MKAQNILFLLLLVCFNGRGQELLFSNGNSIFEDVSLTSSNRKLFDNHSRKSARNQDEFIYKLDSIVISYLNSANNIETGVTYFYYNERNENSSYIENFYRSTGELRSQNSVNYLYNEEGEIIEITRQTTNFTITLSNDTLEQRTERKVNYAYDQAGNRIEEISSIKNNQVQTWFLLTKLTYAYNSLGNLITDERYNYSLSTQQWSIQEQNLHYYDTVTNRISKREHYAFNSTTNELVLEEVREFVYDDNTNSNTETISAVEVSEDGTTTLYPFTKIETILNSQNQILDIKGYYNDPDEVLTYWVNREYDELYNIRNNTVIRNEDYFSQVSTKENFEVDASISMSDIYLPHYLREPVNYYTSFRNKLTKLTTFNLGMSDSTWVREGEYNYFYSKFPEPIALQEGTFIYPNPASDVLHTIYPANTSFKLYNTLGQIVFETVTTIDNQVLNLPSLVTGVYIYKSSIDEGRVVIR